MKRGFLSENQQPAWVGNGEPIQRQENGQLVTYYPLGDTRAYVEMNNLGTSVMYKVGQVMARPSVDGRQNAGTNLQGGFAEREGYTENANSMIVRNPKGEEYQVPIDEFNKKYKLAPGSRPDKDGYSTYNAFDKRIISGVIKHNLYKEMPNWGPGQKQFGRMGDAHLVNPQSADSYFIGDHELKSTHTTNPGVQNESVVRLTESGLRGLIHEAVEDVIRRLYND